MASRIKLDNIPFPTQENWKFIENRKSLVSVIFPVATQREAG